MSIDWSKAPEGATHWQPENEHLRESWIKIDGGQYWFRMPGATPWVPYNGPAIWIADIIPRPSEWNGEDLPPVGTVCEWAGCTFAPEDPEEPDLHIGDKVTIIAHFKDGEVDLAAFTFNPQIHNHDRGTAWVNQGAHGCFRPIRTAEQIAADERDKSIKEMAEIWQFAQSNAADGFIALYAAGYRKQEQK